VTKHTTQKTTIGAIAQAVRLFDAGSVSSAAIQQAKLLLLDTIGCGFAGRHEPVAQAVLQAMPGTGGPCALIGQSAKANPSEAVFLNGALIRVLDLNDYIIGEAHGEPETGGHPSDNIPVALAVGAAMHRSGREILAAIVLGYELYARLHQAMDRSGPWDGVSVSGVVAPAIAGLLMGLSEKHLAHALALGAARAATPSIVRSGDISATKSLCQRSCRASGVQAAMLARRA
jgi:2-methylcitrate dehydratase